MYKRQDTSTNDTALLLANGMAGNKKIKKGTPEFEVFQEALHYVNETLAKMMAGDGEGATAVSYTHLYRKRAFFRQSG